MISKQPHNIITMTYICTSKCTFKSLTFVHIQVVVNCFVESIDNDKYIDIPPKNLRKHITIMTNNTLRKRYIVF